MLSNRITPACAGRSHKAVNASGCVPDHPRVCGEKRIIRREQCTSTGSPPRVRGEELLPGVEIGNCGITPACAGRSFYPFTPDRLDEDHPRVCGEKREDGPRADLRQGSPPRVRGEVDAETQNAYSGRITPACAGRSATISSMHSKAPDHPRVCGEKRANAFKKTFRIGSPPRVRGEALRAPALPVNLRITPACAGRSFLLSTLFLHFTDHPRVCGEKCLLFRHL